MRLPSLIGAGLAGIAAVLLFVALFVPWQSVDVFGFHSDLGLWGVSFDAGGGSDSSSWDEVADSGEDTAKIHAAQAFAIIATVAALLGSGAAVATALMGLTRWVAGGLAGLALVSCVLALVLLPAGVGDVMGEDFSDAYDPTHGTNLAISGAVFVGLSALVILSAPWLQRVRLVTDADPEESG